MNLSIRLTLGTSALALATDVALSLVTYRDVETDTRLAALTAAAVAAAIVAAVALTIGPVRSLAQPLCSMTCATVAFLGGRWLAEPSSEVRR